MAKTSAFLPVKPRRQKRSGVYTKPQTDSTIGYDSRLRERMPGTLTYQKIREIRKDPTIALLRQVPAAQAIHTEWTIQAKENAPSGAKEFIEKALYPHRLELLMTTFMGVCDFGWMPYEKVLQEQDGFLTYRRYKPLLHDFTHVLVYVNSGEFAGYDNDPSNVFDITDFDVNTRLYENECLHVNFEKEADNWYGRSISEDLESTYDRYVDVNDTASRYDAKVAGAHWIVYYPVGYTDYNGQTEVSNQEIAEDLLEKLEASGMMAIPDEVQEFMEDGPGKEMKGKWRVELLSAREGGQSSFIDRLKYLDALKVRAFHLPERSVIEGTFGTKAEAETHTDIGLSTIDVKHRIAVQHYNRQIINELLRLNYGEEAMDTVYIMVAPLVDSRLSILKEVYRLLLQNPMSLIREMSNLDRDAIREELNLPAVPKQEAERIMEEERTFLNLEKESEAPGGVKKGQVDFRTADGEDKDNESNL